MQQIKLICFWCLSLDRLPTRSQLAYRGVGIPNILLSLLYNVEPGDAVDFWM